MGSSFTRRWARLGLYLGLAAAAGITLYWALAARRADWADWSDDPAVDAHRYASAVSVPVSLLAFALWPALKQFAYWPWVVVLGPALNGMALGALAGSLRDRAGTRGRLDITTPRWTTIGLLVVGAPALWAGLIGVVVVALAVYYLGPYNGIALLLARSRDVEAVSSLLSAAWLALPLGSILIKRAVPPAGRWLLWFVLLGAAVYTVVGLLPRAPGSASGAFPILRHVLAWLVIGFGAFVAAAPVAQPRAVPSPDRLRLLRSALRYALIACATPFLVLSPQSLPAIVILGLQLWSTRRRHGADSGVPPARLAQWGCVALGLSLGYAMLGPWLGGPALTFPHRWLGSAETLAQIGVLAGALLIQIGVWETARTLPFARRPTAPPLSPTQTPPVPAIAPPGRAPEVAWAGLILAGVLFALSVAASSAGLHPTRRTEGMQLAAGVLMYLCGRATVWPVLCVFGVAIALLALHVLLLAPLLISIR